MIPCHYGGQEVRLPAVGKLEMQEFSSVLKGSEPQSLDSRYSWSLKALDPRWLSTFLTLWLFSALPHTEIAPTYNIISLLLPNCNFATVMNHNINTWCAEYLICDPQRVHNPQVENHCLRLNRAESEDQGSSCSRQARGESSLAGPWWAGQCCPGLEVRPHSDN